ncbi:hypothetical protein B0H16DRAFT_1778526 [Mycena metata]|uniref:NB-ARC domain-containing protein n=1 Tax=Mycena metata TaxID=1033252 RepID=A0AAD7MQ12_9AGAR|nr:hypothetical protein B0H16DRAFT_1778526 [Mycena metata]
MSPVSSPNYGPSTRQQPAGKKEASSKFKSEWLAPAILTARTITAAAECAPFPYIKGVSGTVLILLETVENVKKNREDLKELCNTTTEIVTIIHDQIVTHGNTVAVMFKVLCEELESHLKAVIHMLQSLQDQSKGFRGRVQEFVKSSNTTDEIAGYQQKIQALCSKLKASICELAILFLFNGLQLMAIVNTNFTVMDTNMKVDEIHAVMSGPSFVEAPPGRGINNVPPPSRMFQGRQAILTKIHHYFTVNLGKQLIYVLHGLGGAGKTQIALKFIQESSANFSDIFLVDASTLDTIDTGLKNVATSKSVGDSVHDALTWLQSKHGDWLLFFDNADDPKLNLNKFFPLCSHGNILITSRNPGLRVYGEHSPVSDMEETDAVTLLLRSAAKESSKENLQVAAKIVKELHYLPLAIAQAGAFISKSEDLVGYLTLYTQNRAQLLREKPEQSHDQYAWTVYTTWQISFDQLSKPAARFLQLCSFLHYTGITEDIFSKASKYSAPVWLPPKEDLQEPLQFLSHFLGPTGGWSPLNFLDITNEIKAYSLMEEQKCFLFIRLFRPGVRAQWRMKAYVACAPDPYLECVSPRGPDFRAAFWHIYFAAEKFKEAHEIIAQVVEKCKLLFGEQHPATLEVIHYLGLTYHKLGEYKKAKELNMLVLGRQTELLGLDHPDTFTRKWITVVGWDHPDTLKAAANLAATYYTQGEFTKAKALEIVVLEKRTQVLGKEHPDTLLVMGNLAMSHKKLGNFEQARWLEVTVLEKRTTLLGKDHPDTLKAMANLAFTYYTQGEFTRAEALELMVLEKRRHLFGDGHPDSILAMQDLAFTYRKLQKLKEAEELEQLVEDSQKLTL